MRTLKKLAIMLTVPPLLTLPHELGNAIMDCDLSAVSDEILNGKSCRLFEYSDNTGACSKIWLSNDYGLPLRVEETDTNNVLVSVYHKFNFNPELPDRLFELPVGSQVVER